MVISNGHLHLLVSNIRVTVTQQHHLSKKGEFSDQFSHLKPKRSESLNKVSYLIVVGEVVV